MREHNNACRAALKPPVSNDTKRIRYSNPDDPSHQSLRRLSIVQPTSKLVLSCFSDKALSRCDCAKPNRSFHIQAERDTVPFIQLYKSQLAASEYIPAHIHTNTGTVRSQRMFFFVILFKKKAINKNKTCDDKHILFASCESYNTKNWHF